MAKRAGCLLAAASAALLAAAASASESPSHARGQALFEQWCSHCHAPGPGRPGTYMLGLRLGPEMAVLEDRFVPPEFLTYIVRNGFRSMPSYRKTELSDADVASIGLYLSRERDQEDAR